MFRIDKQFYSSNLLERKNNVTVGFENLVKEALRKRVDLIRDDKLLDYCYDAGVILSHQKNMSYFMYWNRRSLNFVQIVTITFVSDHKNV